MANTTNKSGASCLPQAPLPAYKPASPMSSNDETNDSWQTAHDSWEKLTIVETPSCKASDGLSRKRFCRICHQSEENVEENTEESSNDREKIHTTDLEAASIHKAKAKNSKFKENPLIHPCMCVGSVAYIHVDCLNKWRKDSPCRNIYYRCDNCKYKYNLSRPWWAAIFGNVVFLRMMAVFLLLLFIIVASYLAKAVDIYGFHHTPNSDIRNWYYLHGETFLWLDRIYLLAGLIIVSALGLVYLLVICVVGDPSGIDSMGCCCGMGSSGSGITSVGMDGDAGIIILFVCVLVFGWFMILAIIYAAIEKVTGKVLSNVKERILEVPCK